MCGICGVVSPQAELDPRFRRALRPMTTELTHRGPEGEGYLEDPSAVLGHRRLAIIDREHGAQPMFNEDRRFCAVFNGEIYNHHALRQTLERRGHKFHTESDTECIVHAYEEYGTSCVDHLEGMFAFAVYDREDRELFLARDRLGKKPLFYGVFGGAFHFASEIKALSRSPAWSGTLDLSSLESYFSLGYFVSPATPFKGVHKLEPAHWLLLKNGSWRTAKYWDVERFDDYEGSDRELDAELESLIRQAVQARLESEVPLGAFLSGGIDSGLVVSFMAEALRRTVRTTSVGFRDPKFNELAAAESSAKWLQTDHHSAIIEPRLDEDMDRIVRAFDEPFADSSAIPTYYVCAIAKQHVTVVLTGDGGDETFGGYGYRYVPHAVECMVRSVLPSSARTAAMRLGLLWPRGPTMPRALRWGASLENIGRDPAAAYYADLCFGKPQHTSQLLGLGDTRVLAESSVYETVTQAYRSCPSPDPVQCAQYADLKIYLPNDVLVKVDRMSMSHSLEIRCPLLDRRLVEFAFRIPRARKMPGLRPKYLLRRLAKARLPTEVLRQPKRGFSVPLARLLSGKQGNSFAAEVLTTTSVCSGLLDIDYVRRLFESHRRGEADHSYLLWAIWVLERWCGLQRGLSAHSESRDAAAV